MVMIEIITNYSIYFALFFGLVSGFIILNSLFLKSAIQNKFLICIIFSSFSLVAVLLFASFEDLISTHIFRFGAISSYGIYFFCPIFLYLLFFKKEDIHELFDMYAVYVCPSMVFQRFHCLLAGCCSGKSFFHTLILYD